MTSVKQRSGSDAEPQLSFGERFSDRCNPILVREVTPERVKEHFGELCRGSVERFELPNLHALNFLLHESLGGGGTVSLRTDAQGKTLSAALLRMTVNVAEGEVA